MYKYLSRVNHFWATFIDILRLFTGHTGSKHTGYKKQLDSAKCRRNHCDQIWRFWKFWVTNFLAYVSQTLKDLCNNYDINAFLLKTVVPTFGAIFWKIGLNFILSSGHTRRNLRRRQFWQKVLWSPWSCSGSISATWTSWTRSTPWASTTWGPSGPRGWLSPTPLGRTRQRFTIHRESRRQIEVAFPCNPPKNQTLFGHFWKKDKNI